MKKNKMDTQEYQFIKETVKKQPKENGSLLRRLLMIAGCGVLFGSCAAVTFASVFPVMADREENTQQKIELTGSDVAETISEEQATERESVASVSEQEEKSLLAMRQEMYREVLKVSQKSRKSLVNVRGISKDEDLLNNSYLQQEDTEGLVFLETETQFYILTYEEEMENLQELQVTFADGSTVQGEICRGDADSGFAVATVRKNLLNDSTREGIVVSDLTDTKKLGQSDIVIAIGSPAGDSDAVVYGMITSVSEKLSVADTEYNVLATDVQGNEDGSGVLLDSDGNVAGIILANNITKHKCPLSNRLLQIKSILSLYSSKEGRNVSKIFGNVNGIDKQLLNENNKTYPAELALFAVSSSCRGKGIGKMLFQSALNYMKQEKLREFYLFTDTSCNYGFYEHQGMKRRLEKKHVFNIKGQQAVMNFFIYDYQLSN